MLILNMKEKKVYRKNHWEQAPMSYPVIKEDFDLVLVNEFKEKNPSFIIKDGRDELDIDCNEFINLASGYGYTLKGDAVDC